MSNILRNFERGSFLLTNVEVGIGITLVMCTFANETFD
jgi:hypothetical protein